MVNKTDEKASISVSVKHLANLLIQYRIRTFNQKADFSKISEPNELALELYEVEKKKYDIKELEYKIEEIDSKIIERCREKSSNIGNGIHLCFDYENDNRIYIREYWLDGVNFRIGGKPDRVYGNGVIEEFKTVMNGSRKWIQILQGIYQLALYCPYTNTQIGILSLLNIEAGRIERVLYYIPIEAQESILKNALKLYIKVIGKNNELDSNLP